MQLEDGVTSRSASVVHRAFGMTGVATFPVGLGAMSLSMRGRPDEDIGLATIRAAIAAGIDFIDTANVYCAGDDEIGHNERLIAKALRSSELGRGVTVATKGGVDRLQRRVDASPRFLRESCLGSLRALDCEVIDVYQLHAPDVAVPFEDSVGELSRLRDEGKIRHIGLCNVSVDHLDIARKIARVESVQNACHPFGSGDYGSGMITACEDMQVAFLPHSVIGGAHHHHALTRHPTLVRLARTYGTSPYAIVIAWHLAQSACVIPIPGGRSPATVSASAAVANLQLEPDDIAAVSAMTPEPSLGS